MILKVMGGELLISLISLIFIFWALDKGPKDAITELYKHLSYASLSSANDFNFDSLLDLISGLTFKMKGSTLANRDKQQKKD